jgi:hypothetical protein
VRRGADHRHAADLRAGDVDLAAIRGRRYRGRTIADREDSRDGVRELAGPDHAGPPRRHARPVFGQIPVARSPGAAVPRRPATRLVDGLQRRLHRLLHRPGIRSQPDQGQRPPNPRIPADTRLRPGHDHRHRAMARRRQRSHSKTDGAPRLCRHVFAGQHERASGLDSADRFPDL